MTVLWTIIGVLVLTVAVLLCKVLSLKRAAREIATEFAARLKVDTNTLIGISSRDKTMCRLANDINAELRLLRAARRRYLDGDRELKEAVTNISHDLRTPLTAICGYLDLLEAEEQSKEVSDYLAHIRNRTEAMKQLTEELFRYSVILSVQREPCLEAVSLGNVIEESVAELYGALTARGIAPVITLPESKVVRLLDRKFLTRVLENILGNAIKYSDGDLEITLSETGEILFANTAAGLDAVQVGKLFHRFFTVEAARNSTGLGLSIAKTLTEQMGGTISARYEGKRLLIVLSFCESACAARAD